ncbi:ankyrin repeat domain-containing protein [Endozoicomonas sp.]|uniref:ankyrin repeat domain-containing protein n=1 Tax=Endozoicomonas sp. TaxID=1892382 RepID=UPI0028873BE6|nr:ankyrin repeat domain-containing protein [Endozoicomonas sp.]
MSPSLASLATLHGPSFIIPDEVSDDSYTLDSTLWDSTAFGLNVKVVSNISQYMGSFTIPLNRDNGEWKPAVDLHLKHDHHPQPLRTRHIRSFENISTSEKWTTARHWLESNKPDKFRECINNESNETTKHKQLTQLLKWAIEEGKIQFIDIILNESERSFDSVTVDGQEMGLIIFAIINMQSGILRTLLNSEKIDKNTVINRNHQIEGNNWSRLCLTIKQYRLDMTKMLIDRGDDPNKASILNDSPGNFTPYSDVSDRLSKKIEEEPEASMEHPSTSRESTQSSKCLIWELCFKTHNIHALELLINNGLNITTPNATRAQPMHIAARLNNLEFIQLLIKNNGDINAKTRPVEKGQINGLSSTQSTAALPPTIYHLTPLHYAAIYNAVTAYHWLKENEADILTDSHKKTAYYYLPKKQEPTQKITRSALFSLSMHHPKKPKGP